ncbi:hypothetical protein E4U41_004617 [Claviceps citrina]|nr:hypothetical protein E4U41_004617 [Claviceps citrina]
MSHITQAEQGLKSLQARNWEEALHRLSKALLVSANPAWLLARSRALVGLKRYQEALDDANLAFHAAFDRNKRDLLIEAQYRRGVAHFRLGQYANADCCCMYAMRLCKGLPAVEKEDPKLDHVDEDGFWTETLQDAKREAAEDPSAKSEGLPFMVPKAPAHINDWRKASTMRIQSLNAMEKLPADDAARKVTVSLKPPRKDLVDLSAAEAGSGNTADASVKVSPQLDLPKAPVVQDYQTNDVINVSVFSRGVNQEALKVEFLPDHVRLNPIVYPDGEEKEWTLWLYSQIDPAASSYTVTPRKIELRLAKKPAGRWPRLIKEESVDQKVETESQELEAFKAARKRAIESAAAHEAEAAASKNAPATAPAAAPPKPAGPAYPTSSRTGPKDWDKIAVDDDEEDEGGVNAFFKKIYGSGTDDQKRAMMKSFTESNGTTLSTDWTDVGSRTVATSPPDGVEAKKW